MIGFLIIRCTAHICDNRSYFYTYKSITPRKIRYGIEANPCMIVGMGTVKLCMLLASRPGLQPRQDAKRSSVCS